MADSAMTGPGKSLRRFPSESSGSNRIPTVRICKCKCTIALSHARLDSLDGAVAVWINSVCRAASYAYVSLSARPSKASRPRGAAAHAFPWDSPYRLPRPANTRMRRSYSKRCGMRAVLAAYGLTTTSSVCALLVERFCVLRKSKRGSVRAEIAKTKRSYSIAVLVFAARELQARRFRHRSRTITPPAFYERSQALRRTQTRSRRCMLTS